MQFSLLLFVILSAGSGRVSNALLSASKVDLVLDHVSNGDCRFSGCQVVESSRRQVVQSWTRGTVITSSYYAVCHPKFLCYI